MAKRKKLKREFVNLTWDDLEEWAGSKIVARGRDYQKHGHVSELARTKDSGLIAWVHGSEEYATKVVMGVGLPDSVCTCPYQLGCKHGVAVVLEYLEQIKKKKDIPEAAKNDERLNLLEDEEPDFVKEEDVPVSKKDKGNVDTFLKSMTKESLIALIHELREQHPEVTEDIIDRQQLQSDDKKPMITRLRKEIKEIANEPGWQDYWNHDGYTPDYSGIRNKLEALLKAGYADDVLSLGKDLISSGIKLVETSNDEGETAMEIEECLPVIIKALERSSIAPVDKLLFAVDSMIDDDYGMLESFSKYIERKDHTAEVWDIIAEKLIKRLKDLKSDKDLDSSRNYKRDEISNWAIHALEKAGRKKEVIPLCEAEAEKTGSFVRLVKRLIEDRRYEDAERWVHNGIKILGNNLPGIVASLRGELLNIRTLKRDWPSVTTIRGYEFVKSPSNTTYMECKKTAEKVKFWPKVRELLLKYLEIGILPWKQKDWPLPEPDFNHSKSSRGESFPLFGTLIDIAILEKNPEQVLAWYDKIPKNNFNWYGVRLDEIATAIQTYAPARAVSMWKKMAENHIAQVNPKAYQEAARYLREAEKVMAGQSHQKEWDSYILQLRKEHARKIRLIEVLDKMHGRPIIQINRDLK